MAPFSQEPFPSGSEQLSGTIYVANACYLRAAADDEVVSRLEQAVVPIVSAAGGTVLAWYVTEQSSNNYAALPVREGINAVVWLAVFANAAKLEECLTPLSARFLNPTETLRLAPTPRSRLR